MLGMAGMELELSDLFGGRRARSTHDPEELSRYFRAAVLEEAEVQYVREG